MPSKKDKESDPYTPEERKVMTELWNIFQPLGIKALEVKSVSVKEFYDCYNAIYAKRAFFQGAQKNGAVMFKKALEKEMKKFLSGVAQEEKKLPPEQQVEHFGNMWGRWNTSIKLLKGLLMYIEENNPETFDIRKEMHTLWKTHMFSKECKSNLVRVVCDVIADYRHGNPANLELVHNLVGSLKAMDEMEVYEPPQKRGLYAPPTIQNKPKCSYDLLRELYKDLMEDTRRFYKEESSRLDVMTPGEAIKYVNDTCLKEKDLFQHHMPFLPSLKIEGVEKVLDDALIIGHLDYFIRGFESIVVSGNVELGKAILNLFKRAKKVDTLVTNYGEIVKAHMLKTFSENKETASKDCLKFIEVAGGEYKRFDGYTHSTFPENSSFLDACNQSMIFALNDNEVLVQMIPASDVNSDLSKNLCVAKIFSEYVQMIMVPGKDRLGEKERGEAETVFIGLYRLLKSKMDFLDRYKNNLARRLIKNESVGFEIELHFLEELKKLGNEESLTQSRSMLNDVAQRQDLAKNFAAYVEKRGQPKMSIEPFLCSSAWPLSMKSHSYRLPERMDLYVRLFKDFYQAVNPGDRKTLSLLSQYGRGEVVFNTPKKKYFLQGTELHLMILPMIKSSKIVSFQQIMDATALTIDELRMQLAFLIRYSFILVKNGEGLPEAAKDNRSSWVPQTVLKANPKFLHKTKFHFQIVLTKDTSKERSAAVTEQEVADATRYHIERVEANIVRIMKTRKDFIVNELFSETAKAVVRWFTLDQKTFSKALSTLVDQEIVERDAENRKKVKYVG